MALSAAKDCNKLNYAILRGVHWIPLSADGMHGMGWDSGDFAYLMMSLWYHHDKQQLACTMGFHIKRRMEGESKIYRDSPKGGP